MLRTLLEAGIPVYTRREFSESFPLFSLDFGVPYHVWHLNLPKESFVTLLDENQWMRLTEDVKVRLLVYQVACGRGHIYNVDWFTEWGMPRRNTVTVEGKWFYVLTSVDWRTYSQEVRRSWVLKWLHRWHKENDEKLMLNLKFEGYDKSVPHHLIREYAGTFADKSGPNCFAAAIAMAVAGAKSSNDDQCRALITQWLHQKPFFRLLDAQGYTKVAELSTTDAAMVDPADVLIWYTGQGEALHAAFAVTNTLVFQKNGQGWESPWQVVPMCDLWYNEYLQSGGYIAVYRR